MFSGKNGEIILAHFIRHHDIVQYREIFYVEGNQRPGREWKIEVVDENDGFACRFGYFCCRFTFNSCFFFLLLLENGP